MEGKKKQEFNVLSQEEMQEVDGGLYAWAIAGGIVGTLYVLDKAYTCGKHVGEALYYAIY